MSIYCISKYADTQIWQSIQKCRMLSFYPMHACVHVKSHQSCLTRCNSMDCSLPRASVHGILQARMLEWVVMSSSRGSSWPRDQTWISCGSCIEGFFMLSHQKKPFLKPYMSLKFTDSISFTISFPTTKILTSLLASLKFSEQPVLSSPCI